MNGTQYEEFCRLFLAEELDIPIETIQSLRIPSATHPDLSTYKNQIDLYWEKEDDHIKYVNIADAKWRGSDKVPIGKVRELQQVKEDINAHKAMMITNIGFTRDAKNFAENKGITLYIVHPDSSCTISDLDQKNRKTIQAQLSESFTNGKPYNFKIINKGFDSDVNTEGQSSTPSKTSAYSKKITQVSSNKIAQQGSNRRTSSNIQKAQRGQSSPRDRWTRRSCPEADGTSERWR